MHIELNKQETTQMGIEHYQCLHHILAKIQQVQFLLIWLQL